MAKIEARRIARRLILLGALVAGLVVQSASYNSQTAAACTENAPLICCSACEADPPPLPCRRGCSPSC
ncbi:MAG TPA: hypothetical protein VGB76_04365 [Pyrinomonadaceae bacterium]|jgi:hypothetical protein